MNTRDGESEGDLTPPVPSEMGEEDKWSAPTPPIPSDETFESPGGGADPTPDKISEDDPFAHFDPPRNPDERGRFAGYRILGLLGSGGMGLVYEAEDPVLRRRVALKVLRPEIAGLVVRVRFLREAQMAASLKDDHVVTIYQVGEEGGRPYLVMERLYGESLEDKLKRERWLPISEAPEDRPADRPGLACGPFRRTGAPRHQAGQHLARATPRRSGAGLGSRSSTSAWPSRSSIKAG